MTEKIKSGARLKGKWTIEHWRGGRLLSKESNFNLIVNEGLDKVLDSTFHNDASATWYVGLKLTGAVAAGDTLASHAGWTEFTDYTGNRQEYVEAAASSQSITNTASPAAFPITGTGAVTGAIMADVATGSAGVLMCGVEFAATKNVVNGDTINVTYQIDAADDGA